MRTNRTMAFAASMALGALMATAAPMEPDAQPEPGTAKNRPGGNTPVPGGGARERARRLARIAKQQPE